MIIQEGIGSVLCLSKNTHPDENDAEKTMVRVGRCLFIRGQCSNILMLAPY
jgi:hypothetical protein